MCGSDEEVRSLSAHVIHMARPSSPQVLHDMEDDEMSQYFRCLTIPKVLIISVSRPSQVSHEVLTNQNAYNLLLLVEDSHVYEGANQYCTQL